MTPCGHHFCKPCLVKKFAAISNVATSTARTFRTRKHPKPCPQCSTNLFEFVSTMQSNQAVVAEIAQHRVKLDEALAAVDAAAAGDDATCADEGAETE